MSYKANRVTVQAVFSFDFDLGWLRKRRLVRDPEYAKLVQMSTGAERMPLSSQLQIRMRQIGKWMKFVGIVQTVFALGAVLYSGIEIYLAANVSAWPYVAVGTVLLVVHAAYFRQALLLQSASDHFIDGTMDNTDAQEHLVLAFKRLRPVFMVDAIAVAILSMHSVLTAVSQG